VADPDQAFFSGGSQIGGRQKISIV